LGALVTANAPALRTLDVARCLLGDVGMAALVDALPHNTHLRTLKCAYNDLTEAFARNRLLPALQANASLRKLDLGIAEELEEGGVQLATLRELQDMVAARAAAVDAAGQL
jgi:hypothetical protein